MPSFNVVSIVSHMSVFGVGGGEVRQRYTLCLVHGTIAEP